MNGRIDRIGSAMPRGKFQQPQHQVRQARRQQLADEFANGEGDALKG